MVNKHVFKRLLIKAQPYVSMVIFMLCGLVIVNNCMAYIMPDSKAIIAVILDSFSNLFYLDDAPDLEHFANQ